MHAAGPAPGCTWLLKATLLGKSAARAPALLAQLSQTATQQPVHESNRLCTLVSPTHPSGRKAPISLKRSGDASRSRMRSAWRCRARSLGNGDTRRTRMSPRQRCGSPGMSSRPTASPFSLPLDFPLPLGVLCAQARQTRRCRKRHCNSLRTVVSTAVCLQCAVSMMTRVPYPGRVASVAACSFACGACYRHGVR